jgi:secreted PhoX family phosphatase
MAGNGTAGFSGDNGPATLAKLGSPAKVAVDQSGNVYICDQANNRIREITNGIIFTIAGNGTYGSSGDNGPATSAELNQPDGVAVDSSGNIYIADLENNRLREITNGIIFTVAGNGTAGFSGDNGPATSAELNMPAGVAVDKAGNIYISDSGNNRIREITNGIIFTEAGNGNSGFSGDNGTAINAELNTPYGVTVDQAENLYISDSGNNRIRIVH